MIAKETEEIINTEVLKSLISRFKLKIGFIVWDSTKVPFIFNDKLLIKIYIEKGWLELSVSDINNWKWNSMPIDSFDPKLITHKEYYEKITSNITNVEILPLETTKYLHYYLSFIEDFLPEIFNGDFTKIEKYMEPMAKSQIEEISKFLAENK